MNTREKLADWIWDVRDRFLQDLYVDAHDDPIGHIIDWLWDVTDRLAAFIFYGYCDID